MNARGGFFLLLDEAVHDLIDAGEPPPRFEYAVIRADTASRKVTRTRITRIDLRDAHADR